MKKLINKLIRFFSNKIFFINKNNDDNLKRIEKLEAELFKLKQASFNDINVNISDFLKSKESRYNNMMKNIIDSCIKMNNHYKTQRSNSLNIITEKNIYNDIKNLIHQISCSNDNYSLFLIYRDIDSLISNYNKEYKEICRELKGITNEIKCFNNVFNKNFKSFKKLFKLNKKYDINKHHKTIISIIKINELWDKERVFNAKKNNYQYIFENLVNITNTKNSSKYDVAIELKKIFNKVMGKTYIPDHMVVKLDSVNENDINSFVKEKINNDETCIKGLSHELLKKEIEKRKNEIE